jgi:SAM-dependent methyltransferase
MSKPQFWQPTADPQAASDPRLRAPSAQRNRDAILAVLADILPSSGLVLEIASGSGEHAVHFAGALPGLTFQPSDPSPDAVASIAAWAAESGLGNVRAPLVIDATAPDWPLESADAILCINMIHIAPWAAAEGLFRHAGRLLKPGQPLYLYGPYRRPDRPLEPGNAAFDESLRGRDPAWGLRELDAVAGLGAASGFTAPDIVEMPSNNLSVIFRKV